MLFGGLRQPIRDMTIKQLAQMVRGIDRSKRSMVDDPMTQAYGAPVGDFFEEWNRKERAALSEILKKTRPGSVRNRWAENRFERYMP